MEKDVTFTCRLGVFIFDSGVRLAHAKLLRDSVMGRYFSPPPRTKPINTEQDIYEFVETLPPLLSHIPFDVSIRR